MDICAYQEHISKHTVFWDGKNVFHLSSTFLVWSILLHQSISLKGWIWLTQMRTVERIVVLFTWSPLSSSSPPCNPTQADCTEIREKEKISNMTVLYYHCLNFYLSSLISMTLRSASMSESINVLRSSCTAKTALCNILVSQEGTSEISAQVLFSMTLPRFMWKTSLHQK